ncbi:MFS transporter [Sporosarcina sp. Marseille-Q4943]|uniref:MFS transporter n=1 Tax=Sporosarcina sp. Marseille-Q4943 TaxID=2942204 RepID=UPI00208DD546|nr:MFS transporter [Sporosarcina sp. Marseille-Q4943]
MEMKKDHKNKIITFFKLYPDFAKLQTGSVLVNFASWNSFVALLFLLTDITDNGIQLGILWALSGLAPLLFGLIAGVLIDRFDYKKGLIYIDILRAGLSLGFIFIPFLDGWSAWTTYFLLRFIIGLCGSYSFAARQSIISKIVATEDLNRAIAISFTILNVMRLLGLTLGGVLLGIGGMNFVWVIQSISFIIAAILVSQMTLNTTPVQIAKKNFIEDFKYGFVESFKNGWVKLIFILGLSGGLVAGTFHLVLQQFVKNIYHTDSFSLSIMFLIEGIVSVIVGYWIVKVNFQFKKIWFYGYIYIVNALSWILFGFNKSYLLALLLLVIFSTMLSLTIPFERWVVQTKVPEEIRGRTFNLLNTISTGMIQLSGLIAGLIIDNWGLEYVPVFTGSFHLLIGFFVIFFIFGLSTATHAKERMI